MRRPPGGKLVEQSDDTEKGWVLEPGEEGERGWYLRPCANHQACCRVNFREERG